MSTQALTSADPGAIIDHDPEATPEQSGSAPVTDHTPYGAADPIVWVNLTGRPVARPVRDKRSVCWVVNAHAGDQFDAIPWSRYRDLEVHMVVTEENVSGVPNVLGELKRLVGQDITVHVIHIGDDGRAYDRDTGRRLFTPRTAQEDRVRKGLVSKRTRATVNSAYAAERLEASGYADTGELQDVDAVMDAAPPKPIVHGHLDAGTLDVLTGPANTGKTAVALDLGLSVSTGRAWGPEATTRGRVVYLIGEGGGRAFGVRVEAWLDHHGVSRDEIRPWFKVRDPSAPFQSHAWDRLADALEAYSPDLVIVDTLTTHQPGVDENATSAASESIAKVADIRRRTGAAVLVLHHPGRAGSHGRGSGAWEDSAESVFRLKADDKGTLKMTTAKQRNHDTTGAWDLRLLEVEVRDNGTFPTSVVAVHTVDAEAEDKAAKASERAARRRASKDDKRAAEAAKDRATVLALVSKATEPVTGAGLEKLARAVGISRSRYERARDALVSADAVTVQSGDRGANIYTLPEASE